MQEYGFSLTRILPYRDRIYNSILILENTGQWKPVFSHILCIAISCNIVKLEKVWHKFYLTQSQQLHTKNKIEFSLRNEIKLEKQRKLKQSPKNRFISANIKNNNTLWNTIAKQKVDPALGFDSVKHIQRLYTLKKWQVLW